MKINDFLNKLYSYENFELWLMVSIIVLILLFIVILFLGKKDKRNREIEATKRLQQINDEDAFKEEKAIEKLEIKDDNSNKELNKEVPNDLPLDAPLMFNNEETKLNDTKEFISPIINLKNEDEESTLNTNSKEEIKPYLTDETLSIKLPNLEELQKNINLESSLEKANKIQPLLFDEEPELKINVPELEVNKELKETNEKEEKIEKIPDINLDNIIDEITEEIKIPSYSNNNTFSSVYPNNKSEEITLPELKNVTERAKVPSSEELEFELPTLKKEYKEEVKKEENVEKLETPKFNNYNIDNITGEYYNINH